MLNRLNGIFSGRRDPAPALPSLAASAAASSGRPPVGERAPTTSLAAPRSSTTSTRSARDPPAEFTSDRTLALVRDLTAAARVEPDHREKQRLLQSAQVCRFEGDVFCLGFR